MRKKVILLSIRKRLKGVSGHALTVPEHDDIASFQLIESHLTLSATSGPTERSGATTYTPIPTRRRGADSEFAALV
jgi:hypothetical protein